MGGYRWKDKHGHCPKASFSPRLVKQYYKRMEVLHSDEKPKSCPYVGAEAENTPVVSKSNGKVGT